jgi:hypothetical protein
MTVFILLKAYTPKRCDDGMVTMWLMGLVTVKQPEAWVKVLLVHHYRGFWADARLRERHLHFHLSFNASSLAQNM